MFEGSKVAEELKSRAGSIARYEQNVAKHYPEDLFGGAEGGVSKQITEAVRDLEKKKNFNVSRIFLNFIYFQSRTSHTN